MESNGQVESALLRIFRDELAIGVPGADADLIEGGLLDSLALVDLLLHLERSFQVTVPVDALEIDRFRTVRSIARFVEEHRPAR